MRCGGGERQIIIQRDKKACKRREKVEDDRSAGTVEKNK